MKHYARALFTGTTAAALGLGTLAGCSSNDSLTAPPSTHVARVTMEFRWPPGSVPRGDNVAESALPVATATPAKNPTAFGTANAPQKIRIGEEVVGSNAPPVGAAPARPTAVAALTPPQLPANAPAESKATESSLWADTTGPRVLPEPGTSSPPALATEPIRQAAPTRPAEPDVRIASTADSANLSGTQTQASIASMASMKQSFPAEIKEIPPYTGTPYSKATVPPEDPSQRLVPDSALRSMLPDGAVTGGPAFHVVNSKRIKLHFEVKDAGPTGIAGVELWYMHDSREWKKPDATLQRRGPFVLEVDGEGLYGFKLIARNGLGRGDAPPRQGEPPQVWVLVDMTKPAVKIHSAKLLQEPDGTKLEVSWNATDKNLTSRPVTVLYSEQASGPWMPLVGNLQASGTMQKKLPTSMPKRFLVRVEASDLAGNVGADQTYETLGFEEPPTRVSILKID